MSGRFYTLGNFPPEDAWGVFSTGTCPDLGGRFVPKQHYKQYPEKSGLFNSLLAVRDTFVELNIRPERNIVYPLLEEILIWETGGREAWRKRS